MSKLLQYFRTMQSMAAGYLQPDAYVDRNDRTSITVGEKDKLFIGDMLHMLDGPEQLEAETDAMSLVEALKNECLKRLDAEIAVNRLLKAIKACSIPPSEHNVKVGRELRAAMADAEKVLECINDEEPLPELEIKRSARELQLALAEGFAPRIDDKDAMRWCKGLQHGEADGSMGLTTVPIDVVYRAMFAFAKRRKED